MLVHTPYLRAHHDWRSGELYPRYRQVILDKLKSAAGLTDIEDRIVVERHLTPPGPSTSATACSTAPSTAWPATDA